MTLRIIGGTLRGRLLKTPKGPQTRPTLAILRKAVFDICQTHITGAHVLDLFAGSGAIGIEAISRGAAHATFVDKDRYALTCIRENLKELEIEPQAQVIAADALVALNKCQKQNLRFDIIYIDPPYAQAACLPDLLTFIDTQALATPGGLVFVEESAPARLEVTLLPLRHLSYVNSRQFSQSVLHQLRGN